MSRLNDLGLPTIDLSRYDPAKPEAERQAFLNDLREAARTWGFFYLTGHGVPDALVRDIIRVSREFFALPQEQKDAIAMIHSPHFRGYTRAGGELTRGLPDWREQIDFNAERKALPREATGLDTPWNRLQGPNQWPAQVPGLQAVVQQWQEACQGIFLRLIRAFALALEQPEDVFDDAFAALPTQHLKVIHYPPRDKVESDQGVGPHKDSCFLPVLLQHEVAGLEVQSLKEDKAWVAGPPVPGTFIINIGESLELASNGYLRANVHRVVSPPAGVDRYSVAYFPGARIDSRIPLLKLPPELAAKALGPETDPKNPLFYDTGLNSLKGRLRSHPDVAQRHYADVLARYGVTLGQGASAY
jgi:isopenicillin N synthase-like dioxygenase